MKYIPSFLCSLLLVASIQAAVPSKESIEKLLVVTNVEKQLLGMQSNIENLTKQAMAQSLQGEALTPEAQQLADTRREKIFGEFKQEISWDNIKELYFQVYTENFSQEEVDGLITFYQSPAGQAFIQKMPIVMQKATGLMQQRMKPAMLKLQQSLKETSDEVKAQKKPDPAPAATPAPTTPAPAGK